MDRIFFNDRVFEQGRFVKCLITRPSVADSVRRPEVKFLLFDAAGKRLDIEVQSPRNLRTRDAKRVQYWAGEIPTASLPTGLFTLEATIGGLTAMREKVTVTRHGS